MDRLEYGLMDRLQYRMFVAGAVLMAGTLVAAPVWDSWYYRATEVAGRFHALGPGPFGVAGIAPPRQAPQPGPGRPAVVQPAIVSGVADPAAPSPEGPAAITTIDRPRPVPRPPAAGTGTMPPGTATAPAGGRQISPALTPTPVSVAVVVAAVAGPAPIDPQTVVEDPAHDPPAEAGPPGRTPDDRDEDGEPSEDGEAVVTTTVWLEPEGRVAAPGRAILVRVLVDAPRPLTSLPFHLLFDPEVVRFVAAREGAAYSGTSLQPILIGGTHPDRPGDVAVGLSFVGSPAVLGPRAEIAILEFEGIAAGDTPLVLDRASARGATGAEQPIQTGVSAISVR